MNLKEYKNLSLKKINEVYLNECNKKDCNIELVNELLTNKSFKNNAQCFYQNNKALEYACNQDNVELVKILTSNNVSHPIKIQSKFQTMYSGMPYSIGEICIISHSHNVLKYLIESYFEFKRNYLHDDKNHLKMIEQLEKSGIKYKQLENTSLNVDQFNIFNWKSNRYNIIKKCCSLGNSETLLWLLDYEVNDKILEMVFLEQIGHSDIKVFEKLIIDNNIPKNDKILEYLAILDNEEKDSIVLKERILDLFDQRELHKKLEEIVPQVEKTNKIVKV